MRHDQKGFSLVELIVVIAIMVSLIAVLALAVTKYLEKSRRSADIANAKEIEKAISFAMVDGVVEINDDNTGIAVIVDKKNPIMVSACYNKDKPKLIRIGKKVTFQQGKNINNTIDGIDNNTRCTQKNVDWYAVTVFRDETSYYWEGKGSRNFTKAKRYEWSELGK